jgi:hypothetical protein
VCRLERTSILSQGLKGCHKECAQEVSKKTEFVEKIRRSRPSNSLKGKHRGAGIGSPREIVAGLRAGERVSWEKHFFISWVHKEKSGRTNPLRRYREVPWVVGYHGGAGRLQCKCGRGSKLRREQSRRSESEGPSDLHVASHIGELRVKVPSCCNGNYDIAIRDIPIGSKPSIVWDTCQGIPRSRGSENWGF